jgi:hypothetical protein
MKITNRHERILMAPPGRIALLIADFDRIWPTEINPAPRLVRIACTRPGGCCGKNSIAPVPCARSG